MLSSVVALIATRSTILITQHFVTGAAVGLFALGSQIGSLVQMAAASLEKAWQPFLYSRDPDSARRSLRGLLSVAASAYTLIALILALFAPEIVAVLSTSEYAGAAVIACICLFGALCFALSSIANGGLYYTTKSGLSMIITVVAGGANVLLCWMLIPRFGVIGAAVSTALAGLVSLTLVFAAVSVTFRLQSARIRVFIPILLGLVLSWVGLVLSPYAGQPFAFPSLAIKLVLVGAYLVVIWKLGWYGALRQGSQPSGTDTASELTPTTAEVRQT